MSQPARDDRIEQLMGDLLRVGVLLAACVVLLGGITYLVRHGQEEISYHEFKGEPAELRHPVDIVQTAAGMGARGIVQFGVLLLIATPVARVAFSALAFAYERDFMYVAFTLIVLAVLCFSLFFEK